MIFLSSLLLIFLLFIVYYGISNTRDAYLRYKKTDLMYKSFWSFLTINTNISISTNKDVFKKTSFYHTHNFEGLILDDFDFSNSTFYDVSFKGSDLKRANFNDCSLNLVDFRGANLEGASFINADIKPRGLILKIYTRFIELLYVLIALSIVFTVVIFISKFIFYVFL